MPNGTVSTGAADDFYQPEAVDSWATRPTNAAEATPEEMARGPTALLLDQLGQSARNNPPVARAHVGLTGPANA